MTRLQSYSKHPMMLIIVDDDNFVKNFNERVAEAIASDPHDLNLEVEGTILWH